MGSSNKLFSSFSSLVLTSYFRLSIIIFLLLCAIFPYGVRSGLVGNSVTPNFTASNFLFIDGSGVFLSSPNGTFKAKISNAKTEGRFFYFLVVHSSSGTIIWCANRNSPVSESSELHFSDHGLTLFDDSRRQVWSTPGNLSSISSLQLLESGNLVMIDNKNNTVWESFDFPTNVIVQGQKLRVGASLVSSVDEYDISAGSYSLIVVNDDALLRWNGVNYWRFSIEPRIFRNSVYAVEYLMMNSTGVYLMGKGGDQVVLSITLLNSNDALDNSLDFRIALMDHQGMFSIRKPVSMDESDKQVFARPDDRCKIPFTCKMLSVCANGACHCPPAFHFDPKLNDTSCVPSDGGYTLPGSCNRSQSNVGRIKYLDLMGDLDYFSNDFVGPVMSGVNHSFCSNLCSSNCSCLGYSFSNYTGSCYVIMNNLGSIMKKSGSTKDRNRLGYIKTIVVRNPDDNMRINKSGFRVLAAVLLPSSGVIVIAVAATFIWFRRKRERWNRSVDSKLSHANSLSGDEEMMDFVSIPGLPVRYAYEELAVATENFKTRIGSGGFGTVYKGTLPDGTDIAVKKITCLGARGRREFLTEIAIIGQIHHINLVRLKGFCARAGLKFLVYEYMSRGSLDATLLRCEPVLEWQERYEIALGTARGLAYLHTECDQKVIHCDVKPENILLHDKSQVKISDFGLSKLLSPEESCLFTTLRGTRGYLAPEWLMSSSISEKTDVYGYGMVLLEIIRGRKNFSPQTRTDSHRGNNVSSPSSGDGRRPIYFPLFAWEMHDQRHYLELVDPRLIGRVNSEDVEKLVRVALCCVQEEPYLRPTMTQVVGMLEGVLPLGEPRMESLNFLRFYGRRFTEESRLEENNEQTALMLFRQQTATNATSSYNSLSYMSSQQVSGPR